MDQLFNTTCSRETGHNASVWHFTGGTKAWHHQHHDGLEWYHEQWQLTKARLEQRLLAEVVGPLSFHFTRLTNHELQLSNF